MFTFTHHEADNLNYSSTDLLKSGKSNCSKTSPPLSPSSLLLGRAKEEEIFLMYKDPGNYKNNFKGRMLFWMVSITVLGLMLLVAYNGGFRSVVTGLNVNDDLNTVIKVWKNIWNSSVPLWSVLIANFLIVLIAATVMESKKLFIKFPKKPLAFLFVSVMCVSSFILFLHPSDEVFYPGMTMIFIQNYFWVILMVKPNDLLANFVHPHLHISNEGLNWTRMNAKAKAFKRPELEIFKSVQV